MKENSTLLLVDDLAENIDILMELLQEYDLIPALDGESALEIASTEKIDLILLDIMMPQMDGYTVSQKLKADPNTAQIPIIFLSAKDHHEDIEKGFECGGVDYVKKPFHPSELKARVQTHLQLRSYQNKLQVQVEKELEKNRLKERLLFEQSKQAALGELLMHISHQWKQPLASLSSIHTLLHAKLDAGIKLDTQELLRTNQEAERQIDFMAQTVDTFRNFYNPSQQQQHFTLSQALEYVLSIVHASLEYEGIKIYSHKIEEEQIYANLNEVAQILFSIISNMRDIFRLRSIANPEIFCTTKNKEITLEDNGGGIEGDAFEAIFEKDMSTHSQSGIGLYLSQAIAAKNKLSLSAKNTKKGASFLLRLDDA